MWKESRSDGCRHCTYTLTCRKKQLSLVPITRSTSAGIQRAKRGLPRVGLPASSTVPAPGVYTVKNTIIHAQDDPIPGSKQKCTDLKVQEQQLQQDLELMWELLRQAQRDLTRRDATVAHLSRTNDCLRRKLAALESAAHVGSQLVDRGVCTHELDIGSSSPALSDSGDVDAVSREHFQHTCPVSLGKPNIGLTDDHSRHVFPSTVETEDPIGNDTHCLSSNVPLTGKSLSVQGLEGSQRDNGGPLRCTRSPRQIRLEGKEPQNIYHTWSEYRYTERSGEDSVEKTLSMEHFTKDNRLWIEGGRGLEKVCRCEVPSDSATSIWRAVCSDSMTDSRSATETCQDRVGTAERTAECLQGSEPLKMHKDNCWHTHSHTDFECSHHSTLGAEQRLIDSGMSSQKTDSVDNIFNECRNVEHENTQQHFSIGTDDDDAVGNVEDATGSGITGDHSSVRVSNGRELEGPYEGTGDSVAPLEEGFLSTKEQQHRDHGESYRTEESSSREMSAGDVVSDTRLESIVEEEMLEVLFIPCAVCDSGGAAAEILPDPLKGDSMVVEISSREGHDQLNIFGHHSHNVHFGTDARCLSSHVTTSVEHDPVTNASKICGANSATQNVGVGEGHVLVSAYTPKYEHSVSGSQDDEVASQIETSVPPGDAPQHSDASYNDLQRDADSSGSNHLEDGCINGAASEADVHESAEGQDESVLQGSTLDVTETAFSQSSLTDNLNCHAGGSHQDFNNRTDMVNDSSTGGGPRMEMKEARASPSSGEESQDETVAQQSTMHIDKTLLIGSGSSCSLTHWTDSSHHGIKDDTRQRHQSTRETGEAPEINVQGARAPQPSEEVDQNEGIVQRSAMHTEETTCNQSSLAHQADSLCEDINDDIEEVDDSRTVGSPERDVQEARASPVVEGETEVESVPQESAMHVEKPTLNHCGSRTCLAHWADSSHPEDTGVAPGMEIGEARASLPSAEDNQEEGVVQGSAMPLEQTACNWPSVSDNFTYQADSLCQDVNNNPEEVDERRTGGTPEMNGQEAKPASEGSQDKSVIKDLTMHMEEAAFNGSSSSTSLTHWAESSHQSIKNDAEETGQAQRMDIANNLEVSASDVESSVLPQLLLDSSLPSKDELTQGDLETVHDAEEEANFRADAAPEVGPQNESVPQTLEERQDTADELGGHVLLAQAALLPQPVLKSSYVDKEEHLGEQSVKHRSDERNEPHSEASPVASIREGRLRHDSEDENASERPVGCDKPCDEPVKCSLGAVADKTECLCKESGKVDAEEETSPSATAPATDVKLGVTLVVLEQERQQVDPTAWRVMQGTPTQQALPDNDSGCGDKTSFEEIITANLEVLTVGSGYITECSLTDQAEKLYEEDAVVHINNILPNDPDGCTIAEMEINNHNVGEDGNSVFERTAEEPASCMQGMQLLIDGDRHEEKEGPCTSPMSDQKMGTRPMADVVPGMDVQKDEMSVKCEKVEVLTENHEQLASHMEEGLLQHLSLGAPTKKLKEDVGTFSEAEAVAECKASIELHQADSKAGGVGEMFPTLEGLVTGSDEYALGASKRLLQKLLGNSCHDDQTELPAKDVTDANPAEEAIMCEGGAVLEVDMEEHEAVPTSHEETLAKTHMEGLLQQPLCCNESCGTETESLNEEVASDLDASEEGPAWEDEIDGEKNEISPPSEGDPAENPIRFDLCVEELKQPSCRDHFGLHAESSAEEAITEKHAGEEASEIEVKAPLEMHIQDCEACSASQEHPAGAFTASTLAPEGKPSQQSFGDNNLASDPDGLHDKTLVTNAEKAAEHSSEVASEVDTEEGEPTASHPSEVDNPDDETETLHTESITSDQEVIAKEDVPENGTAHLTLEEISVHAQREPYPQFSSKDDFPGPGNAAPAESHEAIAGSGAAAEAGEAGSGMCTAAEERQTLGRSLEASAEDRNVQASPPKEDCAAQAKNRHGTYCRAGDNVEEDNLHFVAGSETNSQEGARAPPEEILEVSREEAASHTQCAAVQQSVLINNLTGQAEKLDEVTVAIDTAALHLEMELQRGQSQLPQKEECFTRDSEDLLLSTRDERHELSLLADNLTCTDERLAVESCSDHVGTRKGTQSTARTATREYTEEGARLDRETSSTMVCTIPAREHFEESPFNDTVPSHDYDVLEQKDPEIGEDVFAVNPVLPGHGTMFMHSSSSDVLEEHLDGHREELSDVEQAICFYEDLLDVAQQNFTGVVESLLASLEKTTIQNEVTKAAYMYRRLDPSSFDDCVREKTASQSKELLAHDEGSLSFSNERQTYAHTQISDINLLDTVTVETSSKILGIEMAPSQKNEEGSSQQQKTSDAHIFDSNSNEKSGGSEVESGQNSFMASYKTPLLSSLPIATSHENTHCEDLRMAEDTCCRHATFKEVSPFKQDLAETSAMPRLGLGRGAAAAHADVGIVARPELHSQSVQTEFEDCSAKVMELHMVMSEREEVRRQDMRATCELLEKLEVLQLSEAILSDQVSDLQAERKELRSKTGRLQDELRAWQETVQQQQVLLQQMKDDMEHTEEMLAAEKKEAEGLRQELLAFQDTLLYGKADKEAQTTTDLFRIEGSEKWDQTEDGLALVGSQLACRAREASHAKRHPLAYRGTCSSFHEYLDNLEKRLAGAGPQNHKKHMVGENLAGTLSRGVRGKWQEAKGKDICCSQTEEEKLSLLGARCLYENHPEIITRQAHMLQQLLWAPHTDSKSPRDTSRCSPSACRRGIGEGSTVCPDGALRGHHVHSARSMADLLAMQNELEREMQDIRKTERRLRFATTSRSNIKRR